MEALGPLAAFEVLLSDGRVEQAAAGLRAKHPSLLRDADFVTFIQPAREFTHEQDNGLVVPAYLPDLAVFAIVVDNPRAPGSGLMFSATTSLVSWEQADKEYRHYVGKTDPAVTLFRTVLPELIQTVTNLREMN